MLRKSLTETLASLKNHARDRYYQCGLHIRVRDLSTISETRERTHEQLRHSRVRYDLQALNEGVRRVLKESSNSSILIDMYNNVDLQSDSRTPANILEIRMKNIDSIIDLIEKNPAKFKSVTVATTRNVTYSKIDGIIHQGRYSFPLKGDAKKLIDYLWGKRMIKFQDRSPSQPGRALTSRSIVSNCMIIESKLINVIDNFNHQMKKENHKIDAYIRRKDGLVQLETHNEHPTSK